MKYYFLIIAFLLAAITGRGQTFWNLPNTWNSTVLPSLTQPPCGTWVRDKDTVSDWETVDTLGDKKTRIMNLYVIDGDPTGKVFVDSSRHWVYDEVRPAQNAEFVDAVYYRCGQDPSTYTTQDRIDSLTGIHQRQTNWIRYKYADYQPTPFERLRDSLQGDKRRF